MPDPHTTKHYLFEPSAVAALLSLFTLACLHFAWTTSPVFDEPGLLYSGYANLKAGVPKVQTANMIFAQNWAALPLLTMDLELPTDAEILAVKSPDWDLGNMFVFHEGNDWRTIVRASRVMIMLLGLALCVAVYQWSRELFGPVGGVVSLTLCCLTPTVLANSSVATTDIAVTLWFVLAVNRWWALLHRVSVGNVLMSGVTAGLLLVTKASGLLFAPTAAILLVVRLAVGMPLAVVWPKRAPNQAHGFTRQLTLLLGAGVGALLVVVGVIWASYALQMTVFAAKDAPPLPWVKFAGMPGGLLSVIAGRLHEWRLLPDPYLFDLRLFEAQTVTRRAYLLGEYSLGGWWYFFPAAFWFKTPIPSMALVVLGVCAIFRLDSRAASTPDGRIIATGRKGSFDRYQLAPLVVLAVVFFTASLTAGLNIGIRHVLPIYPALFIVAGATALPPFHRLWGRALLVSLLSWAAVEVWRVHPQYMAYFNQFAGGAENGHRILVDSSYEWGQDLPAVENWLAERSTQPGPKPGVYFSYFGNADLRRFQINAVLLPQYFEFRPVTAYELGPGTYIISATMLHTLYSGLVMGPWRPTYERLYQELTSEMHRLDALMKNPALVQRLLKGKSGPGWAREIRFYDDLRFARLCAYLRQRKPDARITYGMFVFELTLDDLTKALLGPPVELKRDYVVRGTERINQQDLDFLK